MDKTSHTPLSDFFSSILPPTKEGYTDIEKARVVTWNTLSLPDFQRAARLRLAIELIDTVQTPEQA